MASIDLRTARRFVLTHRRSLAALFAALAVLFALGSLQPSEHTVAIVVARHDLAAGSVLRGSDLHGVRLPVAVRPAHAHTSTKGLIGRRVAAPMRKGEALTDFRLLAPGLLDGYDAGFVLSTIAVADSTQLTALRVGGHINIVATDPEGEAATIVIARRAEIVSISSDEGDNPAPTVVVAVREKVGLAIATAETHARLSVLMVA